MSFRKFGPNDIVLNTMRAFPQVRFDVYNFKVYYNNTPHQSGAFSDNILGMSSSLPGATRSGTDGGISLHEYNIDRKGTTTLQPDGTLITTGQNPPIIPYITKDSARASFKTVGKTSYNNEFRYGDTLYSDYPLTASITREFMYPNAGARESVYNTFDSDREFLSGGAPVYRHFYALKNRLDSYG